MSHSPGQQGCDQNSVCCDERWLSFPPSQGTVDGKLCQSWARQVRILAPVLGFGALSSHIRSPTAWLESPHGEGVCWTHTIAS